MTVPLLVSTEWLAQHLSDPHVRVVDVRWYLFEKDKTGQGEYLNGHIPGAVYVNMDTELASPRGQGPGRHPLPTPHQFADAMARAGVTEDTHVIAYDDRGAASAARLWWLLRYMGHETVSLLDGGITRWTAEDRPLEKEVRTYPRSQFTPRPRPEMVVDANTVNAFRDDPAALILDVRAPERYEGKVEPIDPRAGHVPGAKSAPIAANLADDQRFKTPADLRERFSQLGAAQANKVVCYCGSGVNACQSIFALQLAGFSSVLYEGSWSDWSSQPDRPMATGPDPK